MKSKEVIEFVEKNLNDFLKTNNLNLFDVEYVKEGSNWFLRIFIDKENGVTIDDCEFVTKYISKILDDKDPIPNAYTLEVSSPGIDRPLKKEEDYITYKGKMVDIRLYKPINKQKEFQGILIGLENGIVSISDNKDTIEIPLKDISSCRLSVIF